jgi:hypothetical protein
MQVPIRLKSHPELGRRLQQLRKAKRSVSSDAALPDDDLVQAIERDPKSARSLDLTDFHRLQKLFK